MNALLPVFDHVFRGAPASSRLPRARRVLPLAALLLAWLAVTACAGSAKPGGGPATPAVSPSVTGSGSVTTGAIRDACKLVSASDLRSLGVSGAGTPQTTTVGTATVYGCTWGHPQAGELHLQFEPLDPAAARQVRLTFAGAGAVVPGVGDGARGQFGSVLAAVNFYKGDTFASMALFGSAAGTHKAAFLTVAKRVASQL